MFELQALESLTDCGNRQSELLKNQRETEYVLCYILTSYLLVYYSSDYNSLLTMNFRSENFHLSSADKFLSYVQQNDDQYSFPLNGKQAKNGWGQSESPTEDYLWVNRVKTKRVKVEGVKRSKSKMIE